MTHAKIAQLGHPDLRTIASPVSNIETIEIQNVIDEMMECVEQAGGVGIAAPQMHIGLRVFIMCSKPNDRYPDAPLMKPTAIINPEILSKSESMVTDWEGCLSVPSIRGKVPRHQEIEVKYLDRTGKKHTKKIDGFIARVFQHEIDHLDGLTFLDRVQSNKDLMSEQEWYRQFTNNA